MKGCFFMKKRFVRILPLVLTCLFLMASLVSFVGAAPKPFSGSNYEKWETNDVYGNKNLTETLPDGGYRINLTTLRVVGIKQATYMLVWSRDEMSAAEQQKVEDAFRQVDSSKYTDFEFYYGTGLWNKPDFWEKGNSFGRYEVSQIDGTWYLTIKGGVSHFVLGIDTTTPTTTEPTTTTTEPTTTTTEPTTTTTGSTTTTTGSTTTTTEPTTTTTEPTTITTKPTTTTTGSTTTTTESTTTTTGSTATTTSTPDEEIIEEEDVPLVDVPEDPDEQSSPKTGYMDFSWIFLVAAAVSLTVAILLNRRPAENQ